jgi:SAM-dependent methyltransferase
MSPQNEQTLKVYEDFGEVYIQDLAKDSAANPELGEKIQEKLHHYFRQSLAGVPKTGSFFEIGSASGRDAKYLESLGYKIQVSDAATSFIKLLKQKDFDPVQFNLITDEFKQKYDYILANAVLVHFTPTQVKVALNKIYIDLNPKGVFAFSLKQKDDQQEEWKNDVAGQARYFSYWSQSEIKDAVKEAAFTSVNITPGISFQSPWLHIIARKEEK